VPIAEAMQVLAPGRQAWAMAAGHRIAYAAFQAPAYARMTPRAYCRRRLCRGYLLQRTTSGEPRCASNNQSGLAGASSGFSAR
jgi:hypothetical protein